MSAPYSYNQSVIELFRSNGGRMPDGRTLLLLTTTGAKSGQPRTTPLAYSTDGDRIVIVASKGGGPTNPDWYHNLLANPVVAVELGGEGFQARASVADESERERLYSRHADLLPVFADYPKRTTRRIPVVLLERLS
jgi:deazaflavin-dependent oxidoreductase (nitroreductase family)